MNKQNVPVTQIEKLVALAVEWNPECLKADGFDTCLIGVAYRHGHAVLVYDADLCTQLLMERDGMGEEEAIEFFDFNVAGAYMGPGTPIFSYVQNPWEGVPE